MQAVIFDLGGVLYDKSRIRALRQMKQSLFVRYMMSGYNPRHIQKRYFEVLEQIHPSRLLKPNSSYQGLMVPQLINDNMAGAVSNEEAIKIFREGIEKIPIAPVEKRLLLAINEFTFSPKAIASVLVPLDGVILLHDFVQYRAKFPHLKLILLSNFETESFLAVKQKHKDVFDQFDDLIISGDIKLIKPDPAIFQHVLDKHKLEASKCLYFDDAPENIEAAQEMGIKGVQFTTLKDVREKLFQMGVPFILGEDPQNIWVWKHGYDHFDRYNIHVVW